MSASNAFENDNLLLLFNNTNIANLGDATGVRGSTVAGSIYVSLHSADPGETGNQSTNEISYTGYARVAVARSGAGWTVSGTAPTQAVNAATTTFGTCTAGSATATHFGVGFEVSGATRLLASGALNASVAISVGNPIPSFAAGALVVTLD
jgi:hypothetical protein